MSLSRVAAAFLLLAWTALLGTTLLEPAGGTLGASLFDLRSLSGVLLALGRGLLRFGLHALRFAPLGLLAVFVLPDRGSRLRRGVQVALPAALVALLLAWLALLARARSLPGAFEILLPGLGVLFGVCAGLAWRRGPRARLLFLPSVVGQVLVLLVVVAGLAILALDREPALQQKQPPSSAEKRQLVELFRGKNPRKIPAGETRTLRLSETELDRLVCWAASVGVGVRARTAVRLEPGGFSGQASLRVPRSGRWLNVSAATQLGIQEGRLSAANPRLRVGQFTAPALLLDGLAPFLVAGFQGDRDLKRVLPAVQSLTLTPEAFVLTYGRVEMPPGLVARLVWGEEASEATRAAVYAHVDGLLAALERAPQGDARFARALETAFAAARERSAQGSAATDENRAAILALGIVLGHPRLARSVGDRFDEQRAERALQVRTGTTLRGRPDWSRHFTVSGALTVLAAVAPSDAAGLLKEELDADGGSGFSFADLLADRAGTTFTEVATSDEDAAARIQRRLSEGFWVDDFFPPADGLPEGIPDTELQARYGGVGGALYRRQTDEIERRLALCPAYRQ